MNFDMEKFAQEFECAWLGSSGTLISGACLKTLVAKTPIHSGDGLNIYEDKIAGHQYVIVCDVSRGKGLDYSAFQLIDVTNMTMDSVVRLGDLQMPAGVTVVGDPEFVVVTVVTTKIEEVAVVAAPAEGEAAAEGAAEGAAAEGDAAKAAEGDAAKAAGGKPAGGKPAK